jgi:tetratricopeptide (TPR) repeat protein
LQIGNRLKKNKFILYLLHPEKLDESTLNEIKELMADFPLFPTIRMLYLQNLKNINSYKYEKELEKQSVLIPDRSKLYHMLCENRPAKEEPFEILSFDLDSANIESIDNEIPYSTEWQLLPPLSTEQLQQSDDYKNKIIDQFIEKQTSLRPIKPSREPEPIDRSGKSSELDDDLITDTLAKIYMAQGFYSRALEAYQKLSLKFPEKNSYFAAQIEEIKKLMS